MGATIERIEGIENFLARHLAESGGNRVDGAIALRPEIASMRMYERALVGVASVDDPCFEMLCADDVIGAHFMPPCSWLSEARSVVSVFLTFTGRVNESNAALPEWPSEEWLHARIEGQTYVNTLMRDLAEELERMGYPSVVPSSDPRFSSVTHSRGDGRFANKSFTSVWSERHVAYVCGLGTFGLTKGIITEAGAAGRLGSVVTVLRLPPTPRCYSGAYDYCSRCGACARRCPADAIDLVTGKDHAKCSAFLDRTMERYRPRYGCGKCQVGVPCQDGVPVR